MITVKQINYALAVNKTKHFKKAAELSSVSQSALSAAITELENQLNFTVFERDNKRVLTTSLGQEFITKAKQIKILINDISLLATNDSNRLNHPISLGVIPTIGPYLLPKVLPEVRNKHPELPLTIIEEQSKVLVDKVKNGELDSAIIALPYPLEGLHCFEFWQEDFYFISHKDDPLSQLTSINSKQVDQHKLMLLADGHCLKDHILEACQLPRLAEHDSLAGASLYTLTQMVASKIGATLLPYMALDQLISQSTELSAVPLSDPGPHRKLAFITRLNYPNVKNIERLIEVFKQQLALKL